MTLVLYIKAPPGKLRPQTVSHKKRDRFFFAVISFMGLSAIIFAVWPYFVWQISTLPKLTGDIDNFPIPKGQVLSSNSILESNVQVVQDPDGFSYFVPTNFPKEEGNKPQVPRPEEFFVTIPKLKIENARVKVDSLRFDTSLAHFPGTGLPSEVGNSFVTGHSVLPQFNDTKNYRAIFTKLSDLEIGDDVYVEINGRTLHFSVQYSKIVDRHDLSVLAPISKDGRNLTLMTCVPPGTNLKRLVVITSLM